MCKILLWLQERVKLWTKPAALVLVAGLLSDLMWKSKPVSGRITSKVILGGLIIIISVRNIWTDPCHFVWRLLWPRVDSMYQSIEWDRPIFHCLWKTIFQQGIFQMHVGERGRSIDWRNSCRDLLKLGRIEQVASTRRTIPPRGCLTSTTILRAWIWESARASAKLLTGAHGTRTGCNFLSQYYRGWVWNAAFSLASIRFWGSGVT